MVLEFLNVSAEDQQLTVLHGRQAHLERSSTETRIQPGRIVVNKASQCGIQQLL